jgi:ubiquinone/menaquinone biosynthesis C-methylase UbiE
MDAEQLEFETEYFDVVLCGFALFFFPDLKQALTEFYRVLKPDGILATTTFSESDDQLNWYEELFGKYGLAREIPGFESLDHPEAIEIAFTNSGFRNIMISSEIFDAHYQDVHDWWSHLWNTADRKPLESLNEKDLDSLKVEAFREIQKLDTEHGIRVPYNVLLARGEKLRE